MCGCWHAKLHDIWTYFWSEWLIFSSTRPQSTSLYSSFPWAIKPWDIWWQILSSGLILPFSVRWRLWRKRAISLVCRQTTWSNHSLSAHWYVLQRSAPVAEQLLFQSGNSSRELFSSGGSQLSGSLAACCHVPPMFCLMVLLEFIVLLYVWFMGSQQSGF